MVAEPFLYKLYDFFCVFVTFSSVDRCQSMELPWMFRTVHTALERYMARPSWCKCKN